MKNLAGTCTQHLYRRKQEGGEKKGRGMVHWVDLYFRCLLSTFRMDSRRTHYEKDESKNAEFRNYLGWDFRILIIFHTFAHFYCFVTCTICTLYTHISSGPIYPGLERGEPDQIYFLGLAKNLTKPVTFRNQTKSPVWSKFAFRPVYQFFLTPTFHGYVNAGIQKKNGAPLLQK